MGVNKLDTKQFDTVISALREYIFEFTDIKNHFNKTARNMIEHWEGEGKKAFEKDCDEVQINLNDIGDIMSDLADSLIEAEKSYMTADSEVGKSFET